MSKLKTDNSPPITSTSSSSSSIGSGMTTATNNWIPTGNYNIASNVSGSNTIYSLPILEDTYVYDFAVKLLINSMAKQLNNNKYNTLKDLLFSGDNDNVIIARKILEEEVEEDETK